VFAVCQYGSLQDLEFIGNRNESIKTMARPYRLGFWRRLVNLIVHSLLRSGLSPPHTYLLTVPGRRTGKPYSTPVTLVEENGERWLVAPYGEVDWVKNARAAGKVTLGRGSKSETVRIIELVPSEAAPLLKKYVTQVPVVRPFFDVTPRSDMKDFITEAPRHPVFRILRQV
jgi:deazaflavin-dependent oxidoreductase (nitroreductase family)